MNVRSLSFRLAVWHAGIALLVCLGFGLYTYLGLHYFLQRAQANTLQRRADEVAAILAAHLGRESESYITDLIRTSYAPENNDRFIRIRRPDGSILYLSGEPTDHSFHPTDVSMPAERNSEHPITLGHLLLLQTTATINGRPYLLDCGESKIPNTQVLRSFLIMLGFGAPIILIVVAAGGIILVRQSLTPVRRIIDAAQAITSSNLGQRLPVAKTDDEIQHLSEVLNRMIDRLETAIRHSQRFSADASHELRTPLTIMRVELESICQCRSLDMSMREKVASILEETERMGRMVEGLLAISRLETGEAMITISRFDLSLLVSETADQISLLADEKKLAMRCLSMEPIEVTGDRFRIQQMIVNLLDNAIKYTPSGGEVTLRTHAENNEAVFEIEDNGPGIPEEALPHIFERFFRADSVRTHSINGTGLGLSIVRSICLAHSGKIEASNRKEGGCRITVRLPLLLNTDFSKNNE